MEGRSSRREHTTSGAAIRTRRGGRRTQQSTKPRASIRAISIVMRVAFEVRNDRKLSKLNAEPI